MTKFDPLLQVLTKDHKKQEQVLVLCNNGRRPEREGKTKAACLAIMHSQDSNHKRRKIQLSVAQKLVRQEAKIELKIFVLSR